MAWEKLLALSELPPGTLVEAERGDDVYAICNVWGDVRALSGLCPHRGGPLGEGVLNGGTITCPWHMWEFDSATGACTFNESVKVPVYPTRLEDGAVLVDIPA
ncbi:MAG: Rieske 2Fe-2S domain-containing protein [Terriglobia bacterium]